MLRDSIRVIVVLGALGVAADARAQDANACIAASESAVTLRKAGKLIESRAAFATCAAETCPEVIKTECRRRVQETNGLIPGVVFDVKDATGSSVAQVKVTMDDAPLTDHLDGTAIQVNPGQHKFTFEALGQAPVEKTFLIPEGEKAHRETISLASGGGGGNPVTTPTTGGNNGASGAAPDKNKAPEESTTPGQSPHGGVYIQIGAGVGFMYFPDLTPVNQFGTYDWAGFHPDIEFGFHPTGRNDGFVIGLRQGFTMTALIIGGGGRVSGVSQLRIGYDIPVMIAKHELSIDPFATVGVGYVFDGLGFGGPSAGIVANGGLEGKFFVAAGLYAFIRAFEVGVQCFHDVGICGLNTTFSLGVGYTIGGK